MAAAAMSLAALGAAPAVAEDAAVARWREEKCSRYAAAWPGALDFVGTGGISDAFLAGHRAFLDSRCRTGRDICPRSEAERRLADVMTIAAMSAGTASTFPPFRCRG
jgi:hypothetical protein